MFMSSCLFMVVDLIKVVGFECTLKNYQRSQKT